MNNAVTKLQTEDTLGHTTYTVKLLLNNLAYSQYTVPDSLTVLYTYSVNISNEVV